MPRYYFEDVAIFRMYHDMVVSTRVNEVKRVTNIFEENGFQKLWRIWEHSYFRFKEKALERGNIRVKGKEEFISFWNLVSLFFVYGGLLAAVG